MENSKLPTAEEFWSEVISSEKEFSMLTELRKTGLHKHVFEAMRRFARLHTKAALEEADGEVPLYCSEGVLNCYPPERIK